MCVYIVLIVWRRVKSKTPGNKFCGCREAMDEYRRKFSKLFDWMMAVLSSDLRLETENSLNESVGEERKEIHMVINYYPPCPQPDLVVRVTPHSDLVALTILLHDQILGL